MDRVRCKRKRGLTFNPRLKAVSLAVTAALTAMVPDATHAGVTLSGTQTTQQVWDNGDLTVDSGALLAVSAATAVLVIPSASVGTLTNSGMISGSVGVFNNADVAAITLVGTVGGTVTGAINASVKGIENVSGATISLLTNGGVISGASTGIYNQGSIGALSNSGVVIGTNLGLYNGVFGVIDTLSNTGTIGGTSNYGLSNDGTIGRLGAIGALTNDGLITGGYSGINNLGTIGTLTNNGTISGISGGGVFVGGGVGQLTNNGTISGGVVGVYNTGTTDTLSNSGIIKDTSPFTSSTAVYGGGVWNEGSIGTLTNSGTISGNLHGINNAVSVSVGTITTIGTITTLGNSGTIMGGVEGINNGGKIVSLTNSGVISGGTEGIYNAGAIETLTNQRTGTIAGTIIGLDYGIENKGNIDTLTNGGTISVTGGNSAIHNDGGTIGGLTNSGTIAGGNNAIHNVRGSFGPIVNSGVIDGNIENDVSQTLTISGGSGSVFGTLTGFGGLSTIGTISNTHSNLMFASGNLLLNDSIDVGGNTVTNSAATLRVDNPMTVTGNYSQGSAATLLIGVASGAVTTGSLTGDSGYGRLVVSGSATVASGSSVTLQKTGSYAFAAGQRYVVIDASSSGTNYNEGSLKYSINGYTSVLNGTAVAASGRSDLVVTVVSATENPASGTTTGGTDTGSTPANTGSTPRASDLAMRPNAVSSLDGLLGYTGIGTDLLNLYNAATALSTGTSSEATRAGVQLGPASQNNASRAATASTADVLGVVANRADSLRLAQAYGDSGVSTGESGPDKAVWGQVLGGHAGQGNSADVDGFSANYTGLLFGVDRAIGERWRAGGAFSYTTSAVNNTGDSAGDTTRVNAYGLIGYASYTAPRWYANLSAGTVLQHYDTTRVVNFTGFSGTAQGRFDGQQYVMRAEAGYPLALGAYTLTPLSSLTYSYLRQNGYTESGGSGAALLVQASHMTSVTSDFGAKIERGFTTSYGVLVPEVGAAWRHEYVHGRQLTTSRFAADSNGETSFTTTGASPVSDLAVLSAGVTLVRASNLTLTARYELQAAPRYTSQTGTLRLRQLF